MEPDYLVDALTKDLQYALATEAQTVQISFEEAEALLDILESMR